MAGIERLPGPTWIPYAAATLVLVGIAIWSDRFVDPAQLPVPTAFSAIVVFYPLALIHHLDGMARKALHRFAPALSLPETQIERLAYELTTMPRGMALLVTILGTVFVLLGVTESPEEILGPPSMPLVFSVIGFAAFLFTFVSLALLFYHTIRQLWLVSVLHSRAVTINLLQPQPLHAFSILTMRTGIALVLLSYYILAISSGVEMSPVTIGLVGINLSLSIGLFTLPLSGMHTRLQAEKERLNREVSERIESLFVSLHRALEHPEADRIDALNKGLTGLLVEKGMIEGAPTWPWAPGTLRVFGGSVLFPIALLLLSRALERWFGA
ncbi:MAG: hypothetical protein A2Z17_00185 [Gammaproteobacteria bacterium RBG_16_66_13]|nr:MAG: hypothetical protein A2Z17_00185 [Gammaproteobacteria bacterium RBG_16_66_13]